MKARGVVIVGNNGTATGVEEQAASCMLNLAKRHTVWPLIAQCRNSSVILGHNVYWLELPLHPSWYLQLYSKRGGARRSLFAGSRSYNRFPIVGDLQLIT